jgi:hypothetical protein
MNKNQIFGLIVTGLAVVGGVAVYKLIKNPRKNADGFFNADGIEKTKKQYYCRGERGNLYMSATRECKQGGTVVGSTWGY